MADATIVPVTAVSLTAWHGTRPALDAAMRDAFGLALPSPGRWTESRGLIALSLAPDQFELQREGADNLFTALQPVIGAQGALIDLADARTTFRIGGTEVRERLARLLPIDVHPRAFAPGCVAATITAHIPVQLRQLNAAPTYHLACPRSYAESLRDALAVAGIRCN